jgi:sugar phosphate isomerase/epimerase
MNDNPLNRRTLLQATVATLAMGSMSQAQSPKPAASGTLGISYSSYSVRWQASSGDGKLPRMLGAADFLKHAKSLGAAGVQTVVGEWNEAQTREIRELTDREGLFFEGQVQLPRNPADGERFDRQIQNAKAAGASIVRAVCLGGRRYETFSTDAEFAAFVSLSRSKLQQAEPIVSKHQVKLAIENHKDWRIGEMLDLLQRLSSEWVGINLDLGNSIALLEDPLEVVQAYAPLTFTTHFKDMGVRPYDKGFLLSEVPVGEGYLDLAKIIAVCRQSNPAVRFNLEMITRDPLQVPCLTEKFWATMPTVSGRDVARTLSAVRSKASAKPLPMVSGNSRDERIAYEEANVVQSLEYARTKLGL